MTYHQQKGRGYLWSRDCFKILPFVVMQRIARVFQLQLSYLLTVVHHVRKEWTFTKCYICRHYGKHVQCSD